MIFHFLIYPGTETPDTLPPVPWKGFTGVTSVEEAAGMAIQKHLWEAYPSGNLPTLVLTVVYFTDRTPLHKNGMPIRIDTMTVKATPHKEAAPCLCR